MYFTECARLAEQHPDLEGAIEKVDRQLADMGTAEVIRPTEFASFLGADRNQVSAVLQLLAREGLLQAEEMIECLHCQMAALHSDYEDAWEEDGEYTCTSCDRPLNEQTIDRITTYRRGHKWKDSAPPVAARRQDDGSRQTAPAAASPGIELDAHGWYPYARLAEVFGVNKDALRKRLDRFCEENFNGYKENEDRRPREPKYLYQLQAVRKIIEDLRASSERPAK
jgi:transcription initiation factor IIE alpha subunit